MKATDFDFDILDDQISNAPTAGYGPQVNFGKMTVKLEVAAWTGAKGETRKLTVRPYKSGEKLNAEKNEYFQLTFEMDLSELNPALTNPYVRKVDVKRSSGQGTSKPQLTDWSEIVEPSLKKALGANYMKLLTKGAYVEIQDAETVELRNGKKKGFVKKDRLTKEPVLDEAGNEIFYVNTVPQFVRLFKSKADCEAARGERFKKSDDLSFGDDADGEIPAKVVSDVKGLLEALKNEDQVRGILEGNEDYASYDLDVLMAAAKA